MKLGSLLTAVALSSPSAFALKNDRASLQAWAKTLRQEGVATRALMQNFEQGKVTKVFVTQTLAQMNALAQKTRDDLARTVYAKNSAEAKAKIYYLEEASFLAAATQDLSRAFIKSRLAPNDYEILSLAAFKQFVSGHQADQYLAAAQGPATPNPSTLTLIWFKEVLLHSDRMDQLNQQTLKSVGWPNLQAQYNSVYLETAALREQGEKLSTNGDWTDQATQDFLNYLGLEQQALTILKSGLQNRQQAKLKDYRETLVAARGEFVRAYVPTISAGRQQAPKTS